MGAVQACAWPPNCCESKVSQVCFANLTGGQNALYTPDGGRRIRKILEDSGEPMLPLTKHAIDFSAKEPLSVDENWALNFEREKYRREYHALMKERGVDVILCPTYLSAGALIGAPKYWGYTSIWNILDQPGLTFPTGLKVDKNVDLADSSYSPRSEMEKTEWQSCMSSLTARRMPFC